MSILCRRSIRIRRFCFVVLFCECWSEDHGDFTNYRAWCNQT